MQTPDDVAERKQIEQNAVSALMYWRVRQEGFTLVIVWNAAVLDFGRDCTLKIICTTASDMQKSVMNGANGQSLNLQGGMWWRAQHVVARTDTVRMGTDMLRTHVAVPRGHSMAIGAPAAGLSLDPTVPLHGFPARTGGGANSK